jgi:hypothetical protein
MCQGQIGFALALLWAAAFGISGALSVGLSESAPSGVGHAQDSRTQWIGLRQAVFGRDDVPREATRPVPIKAASRS